MLCTFSIDHGGNYSSNDGDKSYKQACIPNQQWYHKFILSKFPLILYFPDWLMFCIDIETVYLFLWLMKTNFHCV